jgi:hypothetical protein
MSARSNRYLVYAGGGLKLVGSIAQAKSAALELEQVQEGSTESRMYYLRFRQGGGVQCSEVALGGRESPTMAFASSEQPMQDVFRFEIQAPELMHELRLCHGALEILKDPAYIYSDRVLPQLVKAVGTLGNFCMNREPGFIIVNQKPHTCVGNRQQVSPPSTHRLWGD